jgi:phage tail protein X
MPGSLEHMVIKAYADEEFNQQVGQFTVWINPASYTHDYSIQYSDRQGPGSNGASPEFNKVCQETVAFELVFDATGVVPQPIAGMPPPANGVSTPIEDFKELAVTVNSDTHRPNFLRLTWAQLQFDCVLSKLNISYTLFRPDGTPLRAKLSVAFTSFSSEVELAEEGDLHSPDMSHLVTVLAGDTLPALCFRIYGSSQYYLGVAAFNGLVNFRALRPGAQLVFPPLSGAAS